MSKGIQHEIKEIEGIRNRQILGSLDASGMRFGIVVARFNYVLTDELCRSAVTCLQENGAKPGSIDIVRVPGAYEIPVIAQKMAASGNYAALLVLGVVVEGETQHAQMIIDTTGQTILDLSCKYKVPIINEIVGVRSWAQAETRCLGGKNTRGWYAAEAAIETAQVYRQLGSFYEK